MDLLPDAGLFTLHGVRFIAARCAPFRFPAQSQGMYRSSCESSRNPTICSLRPEFTT